MVLLAITDNSSDLNKVFTYEAALAKATSQAKPFTYRNEQRRGSQAAETFQMNVVVVSAS